MCAKHISILKYPSTFGFPHTHPHTHMVAQGGSRYLMIRRSENYPWNLGSVRIRPSAVKSSFCGAALCGQRWVSWNSILLIVQVTETEAAGLKRSSVGGNNSLRQPHKCLLFSFGPLTLCLPAKQGPVRPAPLSNSLISRKNNNVRGLFWLK